MESWKRNPQEGFLEEESQSRNPGGILEEESWKNDPRRIFRGLLGLPPELSGGGPKGRSGIILPGFFLQDSSSETPPQGILLEDSSSRIPPQGFLLEDSSSRIPPLGFLF